MYSFSEIKEGDDDDEEDEALAKKDEKAEKEEKEEDNSVTSEPSVITHVVLGKVQWYPDDNPHELVVAAHFCHDDTLVTDCFKSQRALHHRPTLAYMYGFSDANGATVWSL